jgi:hypothetical protein
MSVLERESELRSMSVLERERELRSMSVLERERELRSMSVPETEGERVPIPECPTGKELPTHVFHDP